MKNKTYNKKKVLVVFVGAMILILGLMGRLAYLMKIGRASCRERV